MFFHDSGDGRMHWAAANLSERRSRVDPHREFGNTHERAVLSSLTARGGFVPDGTALGDFLVLKRQRSRRSLRIAQLTSPIVATH